MIRQVRMREQAYVALWHMAADAVIGRTALLASLHRPLTTLTCVAAHASLVEKNRNLFLRGFQVRIVAGYATQTASAGAIALTQS